LGFSDNNIHGDRAFNFVKGKRNTFLKGDILEKCTEIKKKNLADFRAR
jgi:hypothetical protein